MQHMVEDEVRGRRKREYDVAYFCCVFFHHGEGEKSKVEPTQWGYEEGMTLCVCVRVCVCVCVCVCTQVLWECFGSTHMLVIVF